ncbi:MAG TPA: DNA starvation/stationary phase protection protein [Candidatus Kapabacteria bacterium]|nr:DNA starvation/stationary phase protection protein [Candidatus Kapabacteria bacterium]
MKDQSRATEIGLSQKERDGVNRLLTVLQADEYLLYTKTRKYHWNVTGTDFMEMHKFFEAQYDQLDTIIDDVAERVRSLGGTAAGTMKEFLDNTRLKEQPGKNPEAEAMIANLLDDHERIIQSLRADLETAQTKYHDAGTCDFLTGLMEQHEKMAWMLRAYVS